MNLQTARVLIVDDPPANARALAEAIGNDHEILEAGNAARALELAPSCDLVLLGRGPNLGALEVCRKLKAGEATTAIPVILVTTPEPPGAEARALEAGAVDCVLEPVNPAVVRARVRTHLELKAARDLLVRLAATDALTGIANRRRFDEAAQEEWRRSMRTSHPLTLVLAELDPFKEDRHGHGGGDTCLRLVAEALQPLCRRPGELVARFGGEEFACLLPGVDSEGARQFVTRALGAIAAVEVPGVASPGALSVSAGAVALIPSPLNSLEDALRAASQGLSAAKAAGRRRGVVHDLESGEILEVPPLA